MDYGYKNMLAILKSRGVLGENADLDRITIDTIKNSIDYKWNDIKKKYNVDTFFSEGIKIKGINDLRPSKMTKTTGCLWNDKKCNGIKKYIIDKFKNKNQTGGNKHKTRKHHKKGKKKTLKKKGTKTKKNKKGKKKKTLKKKKSKSRK